MTSDNFVVIQGWMCNELNLKGNDLLVFALIYGFSQDGESCFSGSRQYIADTFNISRPTVDKALNNLVENGYIEKFSETKNGVTYNSYKTLQGVKNLYRGGKETLHNNTNNTYSNKTILSKDNIVSESPSEFQFGVKSKQKKSLYQQCLDLINEKFGSFSNVKKLLIQYLDLRLEIAKNEGKPFYANQWKGILNDLIEVHKQGYGLEPTIQQSISKGYKSFYPVNIGDNAKYYNPDTNKSPQHKVDESKRAKDENGNLIKF